MNRMMNNLNRELRKQLAPPEDQPDPGDSAQQPLSSSDLASLRCQSNSIEISPESAPNETMDY